MAYSDYGGYAYKDGIRIVNRSDFTLTPDGKGFESCGAWPGFTAAAQGLNPHEIASYPHGHAVLGDGPVFVTLYKQSQVDIYDGFKPLNIANFIVDATPDSIGDYEGERYVNSDFFIKSETSAKFEINGYTLTIYWVLDDNYYQYVELKQPDGTIWHGWSGYGVGAGLEDCGYGYSTKACEEKLWELFKRPQHEK